MPTSKSMAYTTKVLEAQNFIQYHKTRRCFKSHSSDYSSFKQVPVNGLLYNNHYTSITGYSKFTTYIKTAFNIKMQHKNCKIKLCLIEQL